MPAEPCAFNRRSARLTPWLCKYARSITSVEREGMLEVLERNLTEVPHAKRFDWFYGAQSVGPAVFVDDRRGENATGRRDCVADFTRNLARQ